MKFSNKLVFISVLIFLTVFIFIYISFAFLVKFIIIDKLQEVTKKKVSIAQLVVMPPAKIEIRDFNIEGLFKADSMFVAPSIFGLLRGVVALNEVKLIKPELTFERSLPSVKMQIPVSIPSSVQIPAQSSTVASLQESVQTQTPVSTQAQTTNQMSSTSTVRSFSVVSGDSKLRLPLIIKRTTIKDGKLNFIDHTTVSPEGIRITIENINFNMTNFYSQPSHSVITNFELKGRIPWQKDKQEGSIKADGWFDLFKKDIQATLKIEDIDGIALYPYYSKWVDLEKARIEKAKLDFISNINGKNNNIIAGCHLELTDIVFKPRPEGEEPQKAERIATAVLDIFKNLDQGNIVLDFTIRTKMDKPEFGFSNIKTAFEDKLAMVRRGERFKSEEALLFPLKLLEGVIKEMTNISKAVIDGTFAVGNEFKKAIQGKVSKEENKK